MLFRLSSIAQTLIVFGGVGGVLLAPPANGQMMLLPLTPAAARALPALGLRDGRDLIATGPLPGSLLVEGQRPSFAAFLFRHATLVLASPPGGCLAGAPA